MKKNYTELGIVNLMKIRTFRPFIGQHCETTVTGSLLNQLNIKLSEPMMFGLGEGLGYIFWNMKSMDFPFIGGRVKPMSLTKSLARNLNLKLDMKETTSLKKAWINAKELLDEDIAIGLQLDCYHLEYFTKQIHFAGHFVAMYGYDDYYAYLVDTKQQGGLVKNSLKKLELARSEKGPMSSKNLVYSLRKVEKEYNLLEAIVTAISNNAAEYINPPIKNIGYKGILKTSTELKKWFKRSRDIKYEFCTTAMIMEKAGTGGALFRNFYRDFLKEAYDITKLEYIGEAYCMFIEIASLWTETSQLIDGAGKKNSESLIDKACDVLIELSEKEFSAMTILQKSPVSR